MGHSRFKAAGNKEKQSVTSSSVDLPYSRTPNPRARNYFDEMAPVNGIVQLSQEELAAANRVKEEFRDEISKRMGALLLRGVTMLDQYCQICNGILMEDRNGVRTCITCELHAEKSREGSRIVADIPLDVEDDGLTPGNSHPAAQPEEKTVKKDRPVQGVRVIDVERGRWAAEDTQPHRRKRTSERQAATTTAPAPTASSHCAFEGYNLALQAVDKKLKWAAIQLEETDCLDRTRHLFVMIKEGMSILKQTSTSP